MSSIKEQRIRKITNLYYSKPDVQNAIFEFSKNREIAPSYMMESFGKRPDAFEYKNDIFELVKKGATSFHCSEELWEDPLELNTGMPEDELNKSRIGWDLLIDIDCKWFDYSKLAAKAIIKTLEQHNIKNIGIKFSGSKGFHILLPWKSFPKQINDKSLKDLFPELPRKLVAYLRFFSEKNLKETLPDDFYKQFKDAKIKKGIKCRNCNEIAQTHELIELYCPFCGISETRKIPKDSAQNQKKYFCPECKREFEKNSSKEFYECLKCSLNSQKNPGNFTTSIEVDLYELMGLDIVLVSPRHLFRMPYSLHEKTALASVVLDKNEIEDFELKNADPIKVKVKNFMPDSTEGEAKEFVMQALDWAKDNLKELEKSAKGKYADYKPIKLDSIQDENFPPSIQKILEGVKDGRKRALFILINLFRSIGMEKQEMEKRIEEWNKKNSVPLKQGYIISQLSWAYRNKPILPPNFDKDYYVAIGAPPTQEELQSKNPVTYVVKKSLKVKKKLKKEQ